MSKQHIVEIANAKIDISDIAKNLSAHIDTVSSEREVANIQKSLQEKQKDGKKMERGQSF